LASFPLITISCAVSLYIIFMLINIMSTLINRKI
jgi:hypothetical protein